MFYQFNHLGSPDYIKTESSRNFTFPPHLHQCFEVIVILEGSMTVEVDAERYLLKKGDSCFIFPNQIHSLESTESKHILCIFSPSVVQAYSQKVSDLRPRKNAFSGGLDMAKWLNLLGSDISIFEKKGLLYQICGRFDRNAEYLPHKTDSEKLLYKIFSFVEEEFQSDCSLYTLSQKIGYDYAYLSRTFKKIVGISFNSYVDHYRLSRACYLLTNTNYPVLQVSLECGYTSLRSFNRNFKTRFQMTPAQYRKEQKKQS